jgi:hypothetical protein
MFKKKSKSEEIEMVLLRTTNNNYELDLIKNLLEDANIPYLIKERGIGSYMRMISGDSMYGTHIFIEGKLLEKAETVLDEFPWEELE